MARTKQPRKKKRPFTKIESPIPDLVSGYCTIPKWLNGPEVAFLQNMSTRDLAELNNATDDTLRDIQETQTRTSKAFKRREHLIIDWKFDWPIDDPDLPFAIMREVVAATNEIVAAAFDSKKLPSESTSGS